MCRSIPSTLRLDSTHTSQANSNGAPLLPTTTSTGVAQNDKIELEKKLTQLSGAGAGWLVCGVLVSRRGWSYAPALGRRWLKLSLSLETRESSSDVGGFCPGRDDLSKGRAWRVTFE